MPTFRYKAKRGPEDTVQGEVDARNHQDALSRVAQMGLSPISIHEHAGDTEDRRWASGRGVSSREISVFTRQLASLIRAGVSILRALTTIRDQTPNRRMAAVVGEIHESIRDGSMLSDSLVRYPRLFPELYVNLVRSGETGGVLDVILGRIADAREQEEEVRKKVQAALAYPALMLGMGILTVVVMITFLLPQIAHLFPSQEDLPGPTRIVLAISAAFSQFWYIGVALVGLICISARQTASSTKGRATLHSATLGVPIIGNFVRDADFARFARTLSLLLRTGVPIDRGLALAGDTVENRVLRAEVAAARQQTVTHGTTVAEALEGAAHFPPYIVNMIAVGEETGSLDDSLGEIARYYEREVDVMTRVVTSLLEPILILLVGGVVGFIVFAMLLPIFDLGQSLG